MADITPSGPSGDESHQIRDEVEKMMKGGGAALLRFLMSAIGGSVPFAGGCIGAAAGAWSEREQSKINQLFHSWLKMHEEHIRQIGVTLLEVVARIDSEDPKVQERVRSEAYASLVRKAVREWASGDSEEKRRLIRNLLANAAACQMTPDDVVRLFIDWIRDYSELHFKVIRIVHKNAGWTRADIWSELHGGRVREDSAEADLFKLVVHDLSTGHVIRQAREVDGHGRFLKYQPTRVRRGHASPFVKSAFDDEKEYELTEIGRQFVHYTMNEVVPKLTAATVEPKTTPSEPAAAR